MGRTIGIDLGTTNTVLAVVENGKPTIILTRDHERHIPSMVARYKDSFLVGLAAKNVARANPANFIFSVKRLMGRRLSDPEVEKVRGKVAYKIARAPEDSFSDDIQIISVGQTYSPVQISAEILKRAKADAELKLGEEVTHAVITVPAYFNDNQKAATREAGRLAGLKVRKILDEPSAAALAFGLDLSVEDERTIIVYDLGGGTFDISVISISNGISVVEAVKGDMWLGGNVFDEAIMEFVLEEAEKETAGSRQRLEKDPFFLWQLREQAEQAKKTLGSSGVKDADIFIPGALSGEIDIDVTLTQAEFERRIEGGVDHSIELMNEAMAKASMRAGDITDVLLVGGSTSVPLVRRRLAERFGEGKIRTNVNPMECVAIGAALQAQIIPFILCECGAVNGDDAEQCMVCSKLLGAIQIQIHCPACGASNESDAILCVNPECNKALAMDAPVGNPYGIGLADDRYKIIIPIGTRYPMSDPIYERFFTAEDNQPFLAIPVYQGEAMQRASRNAWQGQIVLTIPEDKRGPSGIPVRVGMGIDRDGILNVKVVGEGILTGVNLTVRVDRNQKVTICPACQYRNPQDAIQCGSCHIDLIQTAPRSLRLCHHCSNDYDRSATVCPKCGAKAPQEDDSFLRALKFQALLAKLGYEDLDWILPADVKDTLKDLLREAETALASENQSACEAITHRLLIEWGETWFHDLAFCLLLSRSEVGTPQQRQEMGEQFELLQTSVRMGEEVKTHNITGTILDIAKQITEMLDNLTCPHCFLSTPPGGRCLHCDKRLGYTGELTDKE